MSGAETTPFKGWRKRHRQYILDTPTQVMVSKERPARLRGALLFFRRLILAALLGWLLVLFRRGRRVQQAPQRFLEFERGKGQRPLILTLRQPVLFVRRLLHCLRWLALAHLHSLPCRV